MKKNVSLIFPPLSDGYKDIVWSVKKTPSPPQTNLSVLGAYIKEYSTCLDSVQCINPQIVENKTPRDYTIEELVNLCRDSDILGLTCLYSNQFAALEIGRHFKEANPEGRVVIGGPNVSNRFMAQSILEQYPSIDYVVLGDGEEALLGLVDDKPIPRVPNLAYRKNGKVRFTPVSPVDMDQIPLWDYEDVLNNTKILNAYDSRSKYYQELEKRYGRTPGEIGVFSQRGCLKAFGEIGNHKGICSFCTSHEISRGIMDPHNFWRQLALLNKKYGLQVFFISDNIFGLSAAELQKFNAAKASFDIPAKVQFRAYTYPAIINSPDSKQIAELLRSLGIGAV